MGILYRTSIWGYERKEEKRKKEKRKRERERRITISQTGMCIVFWE